MVLRKYPTTTYYSVIVWHIAKIFHQVTPPKYSVFHTLQVPELSESGAPLRRILKDSEAVTHEDGFHSTK